MSGFDVVSAVGAGNTSWLLSLRGSSSSAWRARLESGTRRRDLAVFPCVWRRCGRSSVGRLYGRLEAVDVLVLERDPLAGAKAGGRREPDHWPPLAEFCGEVVDLLGGERFGLGSFRLGVWPGEFAGFWLI